MATEAAAEAKAAPLSITRANLVVEAFTIEGIDPYVQHKFSAKAQAQIKATQEAGEKAKKGAKREPKNFDQVYRDAMHVSSDGWHGIPSAAFRMACIDACRLVGFQMTKAKCCIFILADGYDGETPLTKITKGEPRPVENYARNDNGSVDLRMRPLWEPGWQAVVRVQWDADIFSGAEIHNLLERAGLQIGVGEGRPFSKFSGGVGWGRFRVLGK